MLRRERIVQKDKMLPRHIDADYVINSLKSFPFHFRPTPFMGLSGRKVKQRIGHDPRNLSWVDGSSSKSYLHTHGSTN